MDLPRHRKGFEAARTAPHGAAVPWAKDAIVVLGCRVGADGQAGGALLRRCRRAAAAFHDGLSPILLACGGRRWHGHAEADVMRRALSELGVPDAQVLCEARSLTTWGNAVHGGTVLRQLGARRIALVTCDFHQTRALRLFTEAGFDAVGLSCPSPVTASHWRRLQLGELFLRRIQPRVP